MVETLDHHVGQLLAALQNAGIADNTLVIFTADNGGHPDYAANGPLRGSKWNLYEGGIRVPRIIRWPGTVPAGKVNDSPMSGVDLPPTLVAVAGKPVSAGVALDGRNRLPVWRGGSTSDASRSLFWHFPYYHPEAGFEQAQPRISVDDFAASQTRPQSAKGIGSCCISTRMGATSYIISRTIFRNSTTFRFGCRIKPGTCAGSWTITCAESMRVCPCRSNYNEIPTGRKVGIVGRSARLRGPVSGESRGCIEAERRRNP